MFTTASPPATFAELTWIPLKARDNAGFSAATAFLQSDVWVSGFACRTNWARVSSAIREQAALPSPVANALR